MLAHTYFPDVEGDLSADLDGEADRQSRPSKEAWSMGDFMLPTDMATWPPTGNASASPGL